jgi:hypothetical protein
MASPQKTLVFLPFMLLMYSLLLACTAPLASDPLVEPQAKMEAEAQDEIGGEDGDGESQEKAETVAECAGGVVKDDGSVETGYGFVPQAVDGVYLQEFNSNEFRNRAIETVCVCWLKTRLGSEIDFEVVFYEDAGGVPASIPYASVPGTAVDVPNSVQAAGAFWEVDVSGVTLPPGKSYIGARWDPSQGKFLFICTDQSEETPLANVFFKEDLATSWTHVSNSKDPMFRGHRAILVRARAMNEATKN